MPATALTVYPGSTYDLTYDSGGFGWAVAPTPAAIGDSASVQPDLSFGRFHPDFTVPRTAYAEYKLALGVTGIVSIASVRLVAWMMATGTAGTYDTDVSAMVRPTGAGLGAFGVYFSTAVVMTSHSGANEIFGTLAFAPWATNPATAAPWTLSDLAALAFGLRIEAPATDPVNNPSIKLGRLFMIVEATSIPANTEAVRTLLSMPLRTFSRGLDAGQIVAPPLAADVGLVEIFALQHHRGRRPDGPGWGHRSWERACLLTERKSVDFITGQTTLDWINPRRTWTRLWIPGLTTLGHSLDGQGLPLLHSGGGGPAVTRAQVKYINRPGNPTDNVMQGVTEDLLAHDYRGMPIEEGGDINLVLNSTFSQGTGDVFTDWTVTETGSGTVTEETARVGVDEIGLRRAALVNVGVTDSSIAAISQTINVSGDFRLQIRTYNDYGADRLSVLIQRASDSFFWNDTLEVWDAPDVNNRIGNDTTGGYLEWVSKLIPGGDDITVSIGYMGEAGSVLDGIGYRGYVWSVDLVEGEDHVGTPLLTTVSPVTREADIVRILNNEVVRWWGFERGFSWSIGFIPLWNAEDLADGAIRTLLHVDHGDGGYSQFGYQKGDAPIEDRFFFSIFSASVAYTAEYVVAGQALLQPLRGRLVKLSGRWIGAQEELGKPAYQISIAVNDDWEGGIPDVLAGVPTMDPVSTGYLGHAFTGVHEEEGVAVNWANGFLRHFDISPVVLRDSELERRPS